MYRKILLSMFLSIVAQRDPDLAIVKDADVQDQDAVAVQLR